MNSNNSTQNLRRRIALLLVVSIFNLLAFPFFVGFGPNVLATSSPTPAPEAAAFVRQLTLTTNDLVFSQATQKLYASVPGSEGSTGNSVAELDPVSASITNQTFVGSEPTQLALADDGATLYVGLDGAASIRSYNILSHTAGAQFDVGRYRSYPYSFGSIAVSPGNPLVIAVARQERLSLPPAAGVAIFDNGIQRQNTGPTHPDGSRLITFASPSILYGDNSSLGLTTMSVDNSGVTVTGTTQFVAGNSMILANGLLYGSSGQVINPTTGVLVGTFPGVTFDSVHAVDTFNHRVFFLVPGAFGVQLRAYDIDTFLLLGFIDISGITGTCRDLVRWGNNGLAFRTDNRQLFLIETALINPRVDVPTPTPSPSPSPSPSPPSIPTFVRQIDLPANNLVFSEATQALYASVPASGGSNGNSITKINPETGDVGPSVFIGNNPYRMGISNDGQTIWAHLDGDNAARRFDVITGTPGLQFPTSSLRPTVIEVVPGHPESVVVSNGPNGSLTIYDNGVPRPERSGQVISAQFGADPSVLYGSFSHFLVKFLVDSSGVTVTTATPEFLLPSGDSLKFLNGLLYFDSGQVVNPESRTWVGRFQISGPQVMAVDAANHRVFYASSSSGGVIIRAFDLNTFVPLGSITIPGITNKPVNLVRWGVNGLAFNTVPQSGSFELSRVYLVQSELVSDAGSVPVGLKLEGGSFLIDETNVVLPIKVLRTGDESVAVSVDYATSNSSAIAGSDYTATSGTLNFAPGELTKTISIPILDDGVFEGRLFGRRETFNLTLSNPTNSAVLLAPATATIYIEDFEPPPSMSVNPTWVRVVEGNSGMTNFEFRIDMAPASFQTVTVDCEVLQASARSGSDFVASSGTITIPAGATFATLTISIIGDTTVEPNEGFAITLSNPRNAFLFGPHGPQTALLVVDIINDDASVQLANAAPSVSEGAGYATVTVTREGDTSRAATVLYSTTDTAGLQNCALANGKASERCDYGTAMGTVQFAIGETSKTFAIPLVDDALVEGDETFTVNLFSPSGANLGNTSNATITIADNDTVPASQNPIDSVNMFVTQQYIDFLGRLPDTIGLQNWTNTLGNCPNGGFGEFDNPNCDRVHVSAGFFLSDEFRGRGYWAYKFYEVGLDRRPTYAEFVPDMVLVGGPQSPESEAISKAAYTDAFVQRQEFKNRYDALSNSDYVDALETNAEVTLTDKAALIAALDTNQKTRAQVLREIIELQPVTDKFFIRAFVAMQYFGYLRRDPDTIGYDNWVNTLTADPSNFRHVIFGFIYSDEYRCRFGP
jgi:hypothetical protein